MIWKKISQWTLFALKTWWKCSFKIDTRELLTFLCEKYIIAELQYHVEVGRYTGKECESYLTYIWKCEELQNFPSMSIILFHVCGLCGKSKLCCILKFCWLQERPEQTSSLLLQTEHFWHAVSCGGIILYNSLLERIYCKFDVCSS